MAVVITVFAVASLVGAGILRPHRDVGAKLEAYESGMPATGDTRGQHQVKFYMVAMLICRLRSRTRIPLSVGGALCLAHRIG